MSAAQDPPKIGAGACASCRATSPLSVFRRRRRAGTRAGAHGGWREARGKSRSTARNAAAPHPAGGATHPGPRLATHTALQALRPGIMYARRWAVGGRKPVSEAGPLFRGGARTPTPTSPAASPCRCSAVPPQSWRCLLGLMTRAVASPLSTALLVGSCASSPRGTRTAAVTNAPPCTFGTAVACRPRRWRHKTAALVGRPFGGDDVPVAPACPTSAISSSVACRAAAATWSRGAAILFSGGAYSLRCRHTTNPAPLTLPPLDAAAAANPRQRTQSETTAAPPGSTSTTSSSSSTTLPPTNSLPAATAAPPPARLRLGVP